MGMSIRKINNTLELWEIFSETADFKSNEYDKQLLDEIKKGLGFDKRTFIRKGLKTRNISPQQLLSVILKSLKPFSVMMSDLLKMFEAAEAKYSDDNIQIRFDFEDAKLNFDLDLENFRVCQESIKKMVDYELQLELCNPFRDFVHPLESMLVSNRKKDSYHDERIPDEIALWLEKYKTDKENWPILIPLPPKSGIERIDNLISEIWLIPASACNLYNMCYQSDLGRAHSLSEKSEPQKSLFYSDETDFWIGRFVEVVCFIVNEIKRISEEAGSPNISIDKLGDKLEAYRDKMPIVSIESERLLKEFLDLLNLPIWKKRHALYSAWVSTQILSAFKGDQVRFNVENGAISYSFRGSTIAYIYHNSITLKLVAELRTPFDGAKGHSRKHNIQPDYSLCINDESDPRNTVLVVECKQYKNPSKRNFTDAVEDYAGGRPIAQIMLVNYTAIPDSFKSKLPPKVSERVPYFDILIPGDKSCNVFKNIVKASIPKLYSFSLLSKRLPLNLKAKLVVYSPNGEIIEVDNSCKRSEIKFPFVCVDNYDLDGKCKDISALIFQTMKYEYYVQNLGGDVKSGDYSVALLDKKTFAWLRYCVELEQAETWHAFTIENAEICFVDRVDSGPCS